MVTIREIKNNEEFNTFVNMDSDKLHVIKIGAEWCGPCKMLSSTISNLDSTRMDSVLFGEVDIENDGTENIAEEYKIRNIPVLLFIKNNELVKKTVGSMNSEMLYNNIEELK